MKSNEIEKWNELENEWNELEWIRNEMKTLYANFFSHEITSILEAAGQVSDIIVDWKRAGVRFVNL